MEYAHFAHSCCGNPPWYRHKQFPGSWALRDVPLGHSLGGEGTEWLGFLRARYNGVLAAAGLHALDHHIERLADDHAPGTARKPAIRDQADRIAESRPDEGARRRQHFGHARTALGTEIAQHHHIARLDLAIENGFQGGLFVVEHARRAGDARVLEAGDLRDAAFRREIAAQHGERALMLAEERAVSLLRTTAERNADIQAWLERQDALPDHDAEADYQTDYLRELIALTDYPEFDLDTVSALFKQWMKDKEDDILGYRDKADAG